jgi:hypothetical protein
MSQVSNMGWPTFICGSKLLIWRHLAWIATAAVAVSIAGGSPVSGHPRCDAAKSYRKTMAKYEYIIKATPLIKFDNKNEMSGIVRFTDIKFLKWPKTQPKPLEIEIGFYFDIEGDCGWQPNTNQNVFVLSNIDNKLIVVAVYGRKK